MADRPPTTKESHGIPGEVPEASTSEQAAMRATYVDTRQKEPPVPKLEISGATEDSTEDGNPWSDDMEVEDRVSSMQPSARAHQIAEAMTQEEEFPTSVPVVKTTTTTDFKITETQQQFETREFHSLDPREYGIEFNDVEINYEPPERDEDLPDLYRLMASLEDGQTELDARTEPPSLFTRPENVNKYKEISHLRTQLEEAPIGDYVHEFEYGIRDDVLMVGSIELDEVQDEEKRLRDEHIAYQDQEARLQLERHQEILLREDTARKRVAGDLKEKRRLIARQEEILQQRERLMLARLQKSFRRAENHLVSELESRKGEVKIFYGDLMLADGHYGGSKGRRWKVDWDKTPQPIQVKLDCLRGIKDKLPGGRYVLMVSLYNRLGGHVMRWSNLKGQQWGGATLPMVHDGHFYNVEIKVDQSVFTVLPAKSGVRPGMVLVFELFLLRGAVVPTDRVVGWGVFPVADAKFDIVEGKYQCPMLRGETDSRIDKHDKIEALMASDIDHWLGNIYFDIVKLPRYLAGQKEYEVELQFSSGMVAHPDRVNLGGEEYRDGEAPVPGSIPDVTANNSTTNTDSSKMSSFGLESSVDHLENSTPDKQSPVPLDIMETKDGLLGPTGEYKDRKDVQSRPLTHYGSRTVHKDKKVKVTEDTDEDSDYEDDDVYLMKKDDGFYPVKGKPGLFYRKHLHNPIDSYHKKLFSLLPKTPVINQQRRKRKKLTHLEQLDQHTFSVRKPMEDKGHTHSDGVEKLQYVGRQLLAELGLSQWRSREFWGMLFMFVLIFFVRIYVHYAAQWIMLQAIEIPINKFEFLPYTVNLNYQNTLLHTAEEVGVVLLGPCGNLILFILFVCLTWLLQKILGGFPDIGSKFIVVFGIQTFLDPFLILIVDCILGRYNDLGGDNPIADFAKLYWHFYRAEGSGLAGIFITIFLYVFTCFAAGSILYMYFLRLHNNGRMLDIYWRLHGDEELFFVPYDLELSNQEMAYINRKAEQWRGEEGERRKVAVYDYIWEEENIEERVWDESTGEERGDKEESKQETTTHVAIHTLHLDGLRELYRHFLRLPDGAICEVFGDISVAGMDKDVKDAMVQGNKAVEKLGADSQANLRKLPGLTSSGAMDSEEASTPPGSAGSLPGNKKVN